MTLTWDNYSDQWHATYMWNDATQGWILRTNPSPLAVMASVTADDWRTHGMYTDTNLTYDDLVAQRKPRRAPHIQTAKRAKPRPPDTITTGDLNHT